MHTQVLKVHVICRTDEELFLLLCTAHVAVATSNTIILLLLSVLLLLLLLELHISVLVLSMGQCVVQALRVVPGLLCTLLVGSSLGSRGLRKLEVVVTTTLAGVGGDCLHVEATTIHG